LRSSKFGLVLLCLALVFLSCGKGSKPEDYGVSISAPKHLGTPSERFSADQVQLLRITNSLSFHLLNQIYTSTDTIFPFSYSTLGFLQNLYTLTDTTYQRVLEQHYSISDSQAFVQNISDLLSLVSDIDSTIKESTQVQPSKTSPYSDLVQELQIPFPYEGMLNPIQSNFTLMDSSQRQMNFYEISSRFGFFRSETELCLDIPVGNENYSLMILEPMDKDIKTFAQTFTESKYKEIVEKLSYQVLRISLPELKQSTIFSLHFPTINNHTPHERKSCLLTTRVSFLMPTRAMLEHEETDIDTKLRSNTKTEHHILSRPFLYILRSKNTNTILHLGIFLGT